MHITEIFWVIVMRIDRNVLNWHAKPHLNSPKTFHFIEKLYFALQNENLGAVIHENCHTEQKTGFSLCKIYMIKYDLDISLQFSLMKSFDLIKMTHNTVIIQQKARRWICYSTSVLIRLHTDILFSCMIVMDMRTCNSLIWCYSYAVMFDILCYSYWWSTNIWRGLMTLSINLQNNAHSHSHVH